MRPAWVATSAIIAGGLLAGGIGGVALGPSAQAQEQVAPARTEGTPGTPVQWLGMSRRELFRQLGQPSQIIEYPDTGGQLLIYSHAGQDHYVFETGPDAKIIRAARTK